MSDIVEVVKTEMQSAYRNGRAKASGNPVEDIILPNEFVFETLAHTAIKATLEHLRDNVSDGMKEAAMASDSRIAAFRGMLSQAIEEMED